MKVSEVMTNAPYVIDANASVLAAARSMADIDIGMLPVMEEHRLIGVITDRDIVIRVIARDRPPAEVPVRAVLSTEPRFCNAGDDATTIAQKMDDQLIRRLLVVDDDKRLVGIVSIDDIRPRRAA